MAPEDINIFRICVRGPQDHSQVWHFARGTHKTQHIGASQLWFITVNGYKAKSGNQKGTEVKSGDTRLELLRILSEWSQKLSLLLPEMHCDSTYEMFTREAWETQWWVFYRELATWAVSAWHLPKCQTHRRKAFVQHKPHCLYGQFRHSEPLWSVLELLGKGNPFQGLREGSCLMLRNELSKETQSKRLYWPRDYIGKGSPGRERQGREPRIVLPCDSQSQVIW